MATQPGFSLIQLKVVQAAGDRAAGLVTDYYRVAPREWSKMPYEVKTLRALDSSEITDRALAQTFCYQYRRQAGSLVLEQGDLYRICLQDHRILETANRSCAGLEALLTYILTHELVHVVRFGQNLQSLDLPEEHRPREEMKVENTTRSILAASGDWGIVRMLNDDFPVNSKPAARQADARLTLPDANPRVRITE